MPVDIAVRLTREETASGSDLTWLYNGPLLMWEWGGGGTTSNAVFGSGDKAHLTRSARGY